MLLTYYATFTSEEFTVSYRFQKIEILEKLTLSVNSNACVLVGTLHVLLTIQKSQQVRPISNK